MENLNLGAILFIVIATIAIVLILWNLHLNTKIIKDIPGAEILVNGECETGCQCLEGRECFDGRCRQIVPYADPCQLFENCGLPFPPAQFGCFQEISTEDAMLYSQSADIGINQILTIEEIDPSLLTEIALLSFAEWQSYQPVANVPAIIVISAGGYTANQTAVPDQEAYLISNPELDLCNFNIQVNCTPNVNLSGSVGLTVGFASGDESSTNADYVLITHHFNGTLRFFHRLGTNNGGDGNLNEIFSQTATPLVLAEANIYRLEYYNDNLHFSLNGTTIFVFPWVGINSYGLGLYWDQQNAVFNLGFRWSNISCSCTADLPDTSWTPLSNPTPPVENENRIIVSNPNATVTGIIENYEITVSTTGGQKAVRVKFVDVVSTLQFRFTCANYIEFRETIVLNSRSGATIPTNFVSKVGKRYAVLASGVPIVGSLQSRFRSDPLFFTPNFPNGPWSRNGPSSQGGNTLSYAILVDGVEPEWDNNGVYNRDYRYVGVVTGTGDPFGLRFRDSAYGDNSGSYTVQIFELCAPLSGQ